MGEFAGHDQAGGEAAGLGRLQDGGDGSRGLALAEGLDVRHGHLGRAAPRPRRPTS